MKVFSLLLCLCIMQVEAEQQFSAQSRLAMGFYYPSLSNVSNRADIQISLTYWQQEITKKAGLANSYSVLYDDIFEMNTAFQEGKLDMVVAPPLLLVMYFDRHLLSDGFVGVKQANQIEHLAIIARHEVNPLSNGYTGKRLVLPKNDLLAEIFLESEVLKQSQRSYRQIFSLVSKGKKNQRIILDLFFDRADVAVVYESALELMIDLNPQIAREIKIIKTFPIKARNYSYFHRDYQYQKSVHEQGKYFSSSPRGRQILEVFQSTEIEKCLVTELEPIERFYQTYLKLKKAHSHD